MKRWLTLAAAVVLCLALLIGVACGGEEEEAGVEVLKYGAGAPLTGMVSFVGLATKNCMEIAAEDIGVFEVGGKQYRWKVIVEDNKISGEGAIASANKLIFEHRVDIMGQATDTCVMAAAPITEKVPMILEVLSGSTTFIGPDYPHVFGSLLIWEATIPAFVNWLVTEHPEIKVLCITSDETPGGEATEVVWEACCDYYGLEFHSVVATAETVEWYPVATKLMTYEPDAVTGGITMGLAEALWDFGYDGLVFTNWFYEAAATAMGWDRLAEKDRFGTGVIVFGLHPYGGAFPRLEAFAEEYEHRSGMEMGPSVSWIMNNLYYLTDVLQQAGTVDDIERIVATMEGGTFDTLVGQMHFGLEEVVGAPRVAIWPVPIFEIVGESEYVVHKIYTAEEAEALFFEVYGLR